MFTPEFQQKNKVPLLTESNISVVIEILKEHGCKEKIKKVSLQILGLLGTSKLEAVKCFFNNTDSRLKQSKEAIDSLNLEYGILN